MKVQTSEDLKYMICEELDCIAQEGLVGRNLEVGDMLTHMLKSILAIDAMENSEYSRYEDNNYRGNSYGSNRSYRMGRSNRSGRGSSYRGSSYNRGNSYRGGYSREDAKDQMIDTLEDMMDDTQDESVRQIIQGAIQQMEG